MYRIKLEPREMHCVLRRVYWRLGALLLMASLFEGYARSRDPNPRTYQQGAKPLLVLQDANHPKISQDGRRVVVGPEIGVVEVYEASPKRKLQTFRIAGASRQWISSEGKTVAVVGRIKLTDPILVFLDVESGKEIRRVDARLRIGEKVIGVVHIGSAASSDLRLMTSTTSIQLQQGAQHKGVMIFNTESGKIEQGFGELGQQFKGEQMTADGRIVAATRSSHGYAERNETIVWEVGSGKEILRLPFHSYWLALSADGRRIATSHKVANSATKTTTRERGTQVLATSSPYIIEVWDIQTGRRLSQIAGARGKLPQAMSGGALSPDGKLLATEDGEDVLLWDTETGQLLASQLHRKEDAVNSVAFSGNGQLLVAGSMGEVVKVWRVSDLLEDASVK
jgi:WD40 repeat protein